MFDTIRMTEELLSQTHNTTQLVSQIDSGDGRNQVFGYQKMFGFINDHFLNFLSMILLIFAVLRQGLLQPVQLSVVRLCMISSIKDIFPPQLNALPDFLHVCTGTMGRLGSTALLTRTRALLSRMSCLNPKWKACHRKQRVKK